MKEINTKERENEKKPLYSQSTVESKGENKKNHLTSQEIEGEDLRHENHVKSGLKEHYKKKVEVDLLLHEMLHAIQHSKKSSNFLMPEKRDSTTHL